MFWSIFCLFFRTETWAAPPFTSVGDLGTLCSLTWQRHMPVMERALPGRRPEMPPMVGGRQTIVSSSSWGMRMAKKGTKLSGLSITQTMVPCGAEEAQLCKRLRAPGLRRLHPQKRPRGSSDAAKQLWFVCCRTTEKLVFGTGGIGGWLGPEGLGPCPGCTTSLSFPPG